MDELCIGDRQPQMDECIVVGQLQSWKNVFKNQTTLDLVWHALELDSFESRSWCALELESSELECSMEISSSLSRRDLELEM